MYDQFTRSVCDWFKQHVAHCFLQHQLAPLVIDGSVYNWMRVAADKNFIAACCSINLGWFTNGCGSQRTSPLSQPVLLAASTILNSSTTGCGCTIGCRLRLMGLPLQPVAASISSSIGLTASRCMIGCGLQQTSLSLQSVAALISTHRQMVDQSPR